jgi:hypothetical protein
VETDASELGYGSIPKQKMLELNHEQIVRFYSGVWNAAQQNYSTIKKEILSIVLCISKFQDDLLNQKLAEIHFWSLCLGGVFNLVLVF